MNSLFLSLNNRIILAQTGVYFRYSGEKNHSLREPTVVFLPAILLIYLIDKRGD
jgi:hypothetical protein